MKPKVYVDSSIFSVLAGQLSRNPDVAARQRFTRVWWENDAGQFELFASTLVQIEAKQGDPEVAPLRLEIVRSIPQLSFTREAERLADGLIDAGVLPLKSRLDAIHLGIATIHSLEFLVTWNCKHLANGVIYRRVAKFMTENGYNAPDVRTPLELGRVRP